MSSNVNGHFWIRSASIVAILFGLLSIEEGGAILFWSAPARAAAGHFVPFVVWFNFLAGFAYIIAGFGLWSRHSWAAGLAFGVAAATLVVFAAFGIHIASGGLFEPRTIVAMSLRSAVWIAIATVAYRLVWRARAAGVP